MSYFLHKIKTFCINFLPIFIMYDNISGVDCMLKPNLEN